MKCPACFGRLSPVRLGHFTVDVCQGGCGGIWFDAFELQKVDEVHETEGNVLFHIEFDPAVSVDFKRKRECPRCEGVKLARHLYSPKSKVQVDHCPSCAGYWLDAGELSQIQTERRRAMPSGEAQGNNISSDFIRYLYRLQTKPAPRPTEDQ